MDCAVIYSAAALADLQEITAYIAADAKHEIVIGDIRAPVVSYEALLAMKSATGRERDL